MADQKSMLQSKPKLPRTLRVINHTPRAITMPTPTPDGYDQTQLVSIIPGAERRIEAAVLAGHRRTPAVRRLLFNGSVQGVEVLGGLDDAGIAVELSHEEALMAIFDGERIPPMADRMRSAMSEAQAASELGSRLEQPREDLRLDRR